MDKTALTETAQERSDRLLTLKQVQARIPLSGHGIRRLELRGQLPAVRPGGRLRFWRESDVDTFVSGQPVQRYSVPADYPAARATAKAREALKRRAQSLTR